MVAPSGFKESLSADEAADAIEKGIRRAVPDAHIIKAPMADGGEGFTKALINATQGTLHEVMVTGPVGQPVQAHFGFLGTRGANGDAKRTAVLE
ncbi:glycerate kinase, partial [Salmonella enterica]|nr:glycerate kinase [Salmonella enterica]